MEDVADEGLVAALGVDERLAAARVELTDSIELTASLIDGPPGSVRGT